MSAPRDPLPRPALMPVLLSLVAGLGHLALGRSRRGLLLFMLATLGWNLAFVSSVAAAPPLGDWSLRLGIALGLSITAYALFDAGRLGIYSRLPSVRIRRRELLKRGITHYLRGDLLRARQSLDQLLDIDPADPVARLYLATLERRAGRLDRALHHARRALAANPRNRYHPELEREIALVREERRGA